MSITWLRLIRLLLAVVVFDAIQVALKLPGMIVICINLLLSLVGLAYIVCEVANLPSLHSCTFRYGWQRIKQLTWWLGCLILSQTLSLLVLFCDPTTAWLVLIGSLVVLILTFSPEVRHQASIRMSGHLVRHWKV